MFRWLKRIPVILRLRVRPGKYVRMFQKWAGIGPMQLGSDQFWHITIWWGFVVHYTTLEVLNVRKRFEWRYRIFGKSEDAINNVAPSLVSFFALCLTLHFRYNWGWYCWRSRGKSDQGFTIAHPGNRKWSMPGFPRTVCWTCRGSDEDMHMYIYAPHFGSV